MDDKTFVCTLCFWQNLQDDLKDKILYTQKKVQTNVTLLDIFFSSFGQIEIVYRLKKIDIEKV